MDVTNAQITVGIATFGDAYWQELAESHAEPSAHAQAPVIRVHGENLAQARNEVLARCQTARIVFLDADDELEVGYIEAMAAGSADLRAPAVAYIRKGRARAPYVPKVAGHTHECDAECVASGAGNWLVVGSCARVDQMRAAGGWHDWPIYEDFDLWMRMILAGATVEAIPEAIYRATWRRESRNRAPEMAVKNGIHRDIVAANVPAAAA